jgi:hypothetical protein
MNATQRKSGQRNAVQRSAMQGIAKQRGKPVTRVCRVVLAQRHSSESHNTE